MRKFSYAIIPLFLFMLSAVATAGTVRGSRHDLFHIVTQGFSMDVVINNYGEVCVYCHTPHAANTAISVPLWNRPNPIGPYALYTSPTMNTVPEPPNDPSLACLSCHDGTVAPDVILNAPGSGANLSGPWYGVPEAGWPHWVMRNGGHGTCGLCHRGNVGHDARASYLGTDLTNDHPISMTYPTPVEDPAFQTPPDAIRGWIDTPLYNGKVECPTCHDAHDPDISPFLRKSNSGSALCYTCHVK